MKKFWKFNDVIDWTKKSLLDYSYEVHTEKWQGKEIKDNDMYRMIEILNHSFSCAIDPSIEELRKQISPNLPWADDHFQERVSGIPYNPPPSHNWWPFAQKNNSEFGGNEKFSHSYPERIWPKYAGREMEESEIHNKESYESLSAMNGIRYEYGDLQDVINLIHKEPFTRQAFLPIWFPEDTGVVFGGRVPCFIGETEIQTSKGFKMIKLMDLNDLVVTDKSRFRKVSKIMKSYYQGKIVSIRTSNTNTEIKTTTEHPFLVIRNTGYLPSHPKFNWNKEWVEAKDVREGDYVVHTFLNEKIESSYSKDLMRLFGYFLSEGDIRYDTRRGNKKPSCVRFSMSTKDESAGYIKDILDIIWSEFGKIPIIRRGEDKNNPESIRIYFHDVNVAKIIHSLFGSGSYNKIIPEEILKIDPEYQMELLIGYTRGDGSFEPRKKNLECTTISPSIAFGLRTICFRNRINNSLQKIPLRHPYFNKKLNRIIKPNYPSYKLVFSQGGRLSEDFFGNPPGENPREIYKKDWIRDGEVLFNVNSIELLDNSGIDVYNLEIEEDHTYNIINCTVHNCTLGYHFIRRFNHLHIVYYIRSCDFFRHFRDDIYMCARKVLWALEELKKLDPEEWNDVKPGFLTMHITSLHCFAGEKSLLKK